MQDIFSFKGGVLQFDAGNDAPPAWKICWALGGGGGGEGEGRGRLRHFFPSFKKSVSIGDFRNVFKLHAYTLLT